MKKPDTRHLQLIALITGIAGAPLPSLAAAQAKTSTITPDPICFSKGQITGFCLQTETTGRGDTSILFIRNGSETDMCVLNPDGTAYKAKTGADGRPDPIEAESMKNLVTVYGKNDDTASWSEDHFNQYEKAIERVRRDQNFCKPYELKQ